MCSSSVIYKPTSHIPSFFGCCLLHSIAGRRWLLFWTPSTYPRFILYHIPKGHLLLAPVDFFCIWVHISLDLQVINYLIPYLHIFVEPVCTIILSSGGGSFKKRYVDKYIRSIGNILAAVGGARPPSQCAWKGCLSLRTPAWYIYERKTSSYQGLTPPGIHNLIFGHILPVSNPATARDHRPFLGHFHFPDLPRRILQRGNRHGAPPLQHTLFLILFVCPNLQCRNIPPQRLW